MPVLLDFTMATTLAALLVSCAARVPPKSPIAEQVVSAFVRKTSTSAVNHVCVIQGSDHAWVLWSEKRLAVLWRGEPDLRWSNRQLDWDKDFVATQADVGSSTYLETRATLAHLIATCERDGMKFVVRNEAAALGPK
jgi:hypothetical protein